MTRKQIRKLLSLIIEQVDYDIYKNLFVSPEDPDEAKEQIEDLIDLVYENLTQ